MADSRCTGQRSSLNGIAEAKAVHARSAHSRRATRAISAAVPSVPTLTSISRYPRMLNGLFCLTAPASLLCSVLSSHGLKWVTCALRLSATALSYLDLTCAEKGKWGAKSRGWPQVPVELVRTCCCLISNHRNVPRLKRAHKWGSKARYIIRCQGDCRCGSGGPICTSIEQKINKYFNCRYFA